MPKYMIKKMRPYATVTKAPSKLKGAESMIWDYVRVRPHDPIACAMQMIITELENVRLELRLLKKKEELTNAATLCNSTTDHA